MIGQTEQWEQEHISNSCMNLNSVGVISEVHRITGSVNIGQRCSPSGWSVGVPGFLGMPHHAWPNNILGNNEVVAKALATERHTRLRLRLQVWNKTSVSKWGLIVSRHHGIISHQRTSPRKR